MENISKYLVRDKRDKPLSFDWRAQDWQHGLMLSSPPTPQHDLIRKAILLDAFMEAVALNREISYSRNRNWYPRRKQYFPLATYANVTWAIGSSVDAGYLSTWIAPSGKAHGRQSTLRATPKLLAEISMPGNVERVLGALVRFKDKEGKLQGYRPTERTIRMQRELEAHNEALVSMKVSLGMAGTVRNGPLLVFPVVEGKQGPAVVNTSNQGLYRVFNGAWNRGGRSYGHWVQNTPSEYRALIRVSDSETAEPDYDELHLVLTYALAGLLAPRLAYEIANWPRKVAKLAVLILLNAPNFMSARGAIARVLHEQMDLEPQKAEYEATQLIADVKTKHASIANYFHSQLLPQRCRSRAAEHRFQYSRPRSSHPPQAGNYRCSYS